ncbi:hypothetical protein [Flavobacterium sp. PL12]|uniref:hypothetical protein n=1 Tax=Flavobacterium sp. PL12 TaxID=3071718 RepID=UPI00319E003D
MNAIGGYFELELNQNSIYHTDAIALNTGRNALEYILKANQYKKIYLPYFTCDVLLQPIEKLKLEYEFYFINEQLEPIFDYQKINIESCFLYTNYFGLKDKFITSLAQVCKNLVIDNAQSFYSKPVANIDTFYSSRKFFGVPDGSYVYSNNKIEDELKKDISFERFEHLLRRIDQSAEDGYNSFCKNDKKLQNQPILAMSILTKNLMKSIDYDNVAIKRIDNYLCLEKELKSSNKLKLSFDGKIPPMVYPFWATSEIRAKLLQNKIYTAIYWPNVYDWSNKNSLEITLTEEIICLPIDQRQSKKELNKILKIVKNG